MTNVGRGLLIAGTSSDAGKSIVTAGICRALARTGVRVAPFKAQNMSNNSMVCQDGSEIGRAQYLQAQAAQVTPESAMNPVLLKPGTDRRAFIVVRGQPAGTLEAGQYATGRRWLADAAFAAYEELASRFDVVICEGAGSPAEINLRAGDYVNLGLAQRFDLPVLLVGDIDRGGLLASLYGTWAVLDDRDRRLLSGYLVNKFRGDLGVLQPGLVQVSDRTGMPCLGVLPWLPELWLDGEDAFEVARWRAGSQQRQDEGLDGRRLRVAVVRLPRISNSTDVDALAAEPGVDVHATTDPAACLAADLVILPGSRSTLTDLAWLQERGIAGVITRRVTAGRPVLGICGGYQMLAERLEDEVESGLGQQAGLGLLPIEVRFDPVKTLARPHGSWQGHQVDGYEIHHGQARPTGTAEPFLDGWRVGQVWGTMWHGTMENDDFRRAWLAHVAEASGSRWRPDPAAPPFGQRREGMIDTVADAIVEHSDMAALLALIQDGVPVGAPTTSATTSIRAVEPDPVADVGAPDLAEPALAPATARLVPEPDLHHHGDADLDVGLTDLAVNVRGSAPPRWLADLLRDRVTALASYPDPSAAQTAVALRHGLRPEMVLVTAGGAEAFTLLARAIPATRPVVIHPQFTEPEAALWAAGHRPRRHILSAQEDFRLDPERVDPSADLVIIGNPTNPTGRVHSAAVIRQLARVGRTVVVDEAFMDAIVGEPESVIGPDLTGILVVRSLTKTWGIAGLRAGYVLGDPQLIRRLGAQQTPWAVGTLAVVAIEACCREEAIGQARDEYAQVAGERAHLVAGLRDLGLTAFGHPGVPFVLVETSAYGPDSVRPALAQAGFAVRRGESFPGLGPTWIRIAVRDRNTSDALLAALTVLPRRER